MRSINDIGNAAAILESNRDFNGTLVLDAVGRIFPRDVIESSIRETGKQEKRIRRIPAVLTVLLNIGLGLFSAEDMRGILQILLMGLDMAGALTGRPGVSVAAKSSITEARQRLGVRPMRALFWKTVTTLASRERQPRAFYKGMRLMGFDGTTLKIPDTPANEAAFGRPKSSRGKSAFPQVRLLGFQELMTHAFVDFVISRYDHHETRHLGRLLRSVKDDMLILLDKGFFGYHLWKTIRGHGAHILMPCKKNLILDTARTLPDGTWIAKLYPSVQARKKDQNGIEVRVIEYTLDDPVRNPEAKTLRMITSLVEPGRFPAEELVFEYHARWEIELGYDEIKTHMNALNIDIRSQTPPGVVQEIYGILLAHYALRSLMLDAAADVGRQPTDISFTGTLRVLRRYLPFIQTMHHLGQEHWVAILCQKMRKEIAKEILPNRRDRINPRVVKQKMSKFNVKRDHHRGAAQPQKTFRKAVVICRKAS